MADPTSGVFRDPAGNLMTLTSTSPEAFRVLVTRKLERGWKFAPESPVVKPLFDEYRLALPPSYEEITVNVYPDPLPPAPAFAFPTDPNPAATGAELPAPDDDE